jgi:serine/threonine protein kinase
MNPWCQVDVWSLGVVFYQMLYGRRPFGEGCSQEQIMRQGIMLQAAKAEFPSKPAGEKWDSMGGHMHLQEDNTVDALSQTIHMSMSHQLMACSRQAGMITCARDATQFDVRLNLAMLCTALQGLYDQTLSSGVAVR